MTSCGWLLWQMTGEATDIGIFIIALYLFNYIMCHSCSLATILKWLYRKEKERNWELAGVNVLKLVLHLLYIAR